MHFLVVLHLKTEMLGVSNLGLKHKKKFYSNQVLFTNLILILEDKSFFVQKKVAPKYLSLLKQCDFDFFTLDCLCVVKMQSM